MTIPYWERDLNWWFRVGTTTQIENQNSMKGNGVRTKNLVIQDCGDHLNWMWYLWWRKLAHCHYFDSNFDYHYKGFCAFSLLNDFQKLLKLCPNPLDDQTTGSFFSLEDKRHLIVMLFFFLPILFTLIKFQAGAGSSKKIMGKSLYDCCFQVQIIS